MKTLSDKIALLYEFNQDSPLFVRIAYDKFLNDEFEESLKILEKGLIKYPSYITANIVYAQVLGKLGKTAKAVSVLDNVKNSINCNETYNYYKNLFTDSNSENEEFESFIEAQPYIKPGSPNLPQTESPGEMPNDFFDNSLDELAAKLGDAKVSMDDFPGEFSLEELAMEAEQDVGKSLVSETLAGIYLSQGNYEEAMSIYQSLIEIQPGKAALYKMKINEIKNKLEK